ncbi:MAG: hypothetical protein GY858_09635 [Candidatus Omnitrophica bacterium]|nr:hypothetical protein [Candidatus Omnitrophota bacterium]
MIKKYLILLISILFIGCSLAQDNIIDTEEKWKTIVKTENSGKFILIGTFQDRSQLKPGGLRAYSSGVLHIGSEKIPIPYSDNYKSMNLEQYNNKTVRMEATVQILEENGDPYPELNPVSFEMFKNSINNIKKIEEMKN